MNRWRNGVYRPQPVPAGAPGACQESKRFAPLATWLRSDRRQSQSEPRRYELADAIYDDVV